MLIQMVIEKCHIWYMPPSHLCNIQLLVQNIVFAGDPQRNSNPNNIHFVENWTVAYEILEILTDT